MAYKAGDPNPNVPGRTLSQQQADNYNKTAAAKVTAPATTTIKPAPGTTGLDSFGNPKLPSAAQNLEAQKTGINPVSGLKLSDVQAKGVASQNAQIAQMATAGTPEAQNQVYQQNLQKRKDALVASLSSNPNVSPQYIELFKQKWNPQTGKMEGVTDAEWATVPDYKRDMQAEQTVAQKYGSTGDTANQILTTYPPDKVATLIQSGQIDPNLFSASQLQMLGLTGDKIQALVTAGAITPELAAQLQKTGNAMDISYQNKATTPAPTNTAMGVLQEALNAKNNFQNQSLGPSELLTKAGLSGYDVLAQDLAMRKAEMGAKVDSAANLITKTGGQMNDVYKTAVQNFQANQEQFNKLLGMVETASQKQKDYEESIQLMTKQYDLDVAKAEKLAKIQDQYATDNYKPIEVKNADGSSSYYSFDSRTGQMAQLKDSKGNIVGGTGYQGDPAAAVTPNVPAGKTLIGDNIVDDSYYDDFFKVGGYGGQCGTWASTKSTAGKVGNTWAEKKASIEVTPQDVQNGNTPQAGWKLLIPLALPTYGGKNPYGHVAVVTSYNAQTGDISVVEANRGLDGIIHRGKYNLNDLNKKYGDNWGFKQGELRSKVASQSAALGNFTAALLGGTGLKSGVGPTEGGTPENVQKFLKDSGIVSAFQRMASTPEQQAIPNTWSPDQEIQAQDSAYSQYEKQLQPYLIPNPTNNIDTFVNSVIRQTGTAETLAPGRTKEATGVQQAINQKVLQLIPDYSFVNAKSNIKQLDNYRNLTVKLTTSIQNSEGRLTGELANLQKTSAAYPRNGVVELVKVGNLWKYESSDPKYVAFANSINTTADSYASLMKNATGSNAATTDLFLEQALKLLDPNLTNEGLEAQIGQIHTEMDNRMKGALATDVQSQMLPVSSMLPNGEMQLQTAAQLAQQKAGTDQYASLRSQLQPGELLVQDKQGNVGAISQAEFDPSQYTKL